MLEPAATGTVSVIAQDLVSGRGATINEVWEAAIRGFAMTATETAAQQIASDSRVAVVEQNEVTSMSTASPCADHHSSCADGTIPWQLDRLDQRNLPLDGAYDHCDGRENQGWGVDIYVLDTGI